MTHYFAAFNLLLGITGFSWLLWRATNHWESYTSETKTLIMLILALFFCLLAVSTEMLIADTSLSRVVLPIFMIKTFILMLLANTTSSKSTPFSRA